MDQPIIDWELSVKLAGNNFDHAEEYLALLSKELKINLKKIGALKSDHKRLREEVHKILGALCYCGASRLKHATEALHHALKDKSDIEQQLSRFQHEVEEFINEVNTLKR